jgi:hypothetical protein
VTADGEHHRTPCEGELVRDLMTARTRAHDQNAAGCERRRCAIARRVELLDGRRGGGGEPRHGRHGAVARRDDDVACPPFTAIRADPETTGVSLDRGHGRALAHRRAERPRVSLQPRDEFGARGIPGRIVRHLAVRQPVGPVGREQRERVPPLAAPALADPAALEHHVVVTRLGEQAAEREPRLTGADDDRVDGGHDSDSERHAGCAAVAVR